MVLIALWAWLRPLHDQAQKAQQASEAAEQRLQQEGDFQKNAILLEAKEEAFRIRDKAEAELREKLAAVGRTEDRLCAKDEALELRRAQLEDKENQVHREARLLTEREGSIDTLQKSIGAEIQRIASLNKDQARDLYLKRIECEFQEVGLRRAC